MNGEVEYGGFVFCFVVCCFENEDFNSFVKGILGEEGVVKWVVSFGGGVKGVVEGVVVNVEKIGGEIRVVLCVYGFIVNMLDCVFRGILDLLFWGIGYDEG